MLKIQTKPQQIDSVFKAQFLNVFNNEQHIQIVLANSTTLFLYDFDQIINQSFLVKKQIIAGNIIDLNILRISQIQTNNRRSGQEFLPDLILVRTQQLLYTFTHKFEFFCDPYQISSQTFKLFSLQDNVALSLVPNSLILLNLQGLKIQMPIWIQKKIATDALVLDVSLNKGTILIMTKKIIDQQTHNYFWMNEKMEIIQQYKDNINNNYGTCYDINQAKIFSWCRENISVFQKNATKLVYKFETKKQLCIKQISLNFNTTLFVFNRGLICLLQNYEENFIEKIEQLPIGKDDIYDCDVNISNESPKMEFYLFLRGQQSLSLYKIGNMSSRQDLDIDEVGFRMIPQNLIQSVLNYQNGKWNTYSVVGSYNYRSLLKQEIYKPYNILEETKLNQTIKLIELKEIEFYNFSFEFTNKTLIFGKFNQNLVLIQLKDQQAQIIVIDVKRVANVNQISDKQIGCITYNSEYFILDFTNEQPKINLLQKFQFNILKSQSQEKDEWILNEKNEIICLKSQQDSVKIIRTSHIFPQISAYQTFQDQSNLKLYVGDYSKNLSIFQMKFQGDTTFFCEKLQQFSLCTIIQDIIIDSNLQILTGRDNQIYRVNEKEVESLYQPLENSSPAKLFRISENIYLHTDKIINGTQIRYRQSLLNLQEGNSLKILQPQYDCLFFEETNAFIFYSQDSYYAFTGNSVQKIQLFGEELVKSIDVELQQKPLRFLKTKWENKSIIVSEEKCCLVSNKYFQVLCDYTLTNSDGVHVNSIYQEGYVILIFKKGEQFYVKVLQINSSEKRYTLTIVANLNLPSPVYSCLIQPLVLENQIYHLMIVASGQNLYFFELNNEFHKLTKYEISSCNINILELQVHDVSVVKEMQAQQFILKQKIDILTDEFGLTSYQCSIIIPNSYSQGIGKLIIQMQCLWSMPQTNQAFNQFIRLNRQLYLVFSKDMRVLIGEISMSIRSYFCQKSICQFPEIVQSINQISEREWLCNTFSGRIYLVKLGEVIEILQC